MSTRSLNLIVLIFTNMTYLPISTPLTSQGDSIIYRNRHHQDHHHYHNHRYHGKNNNNQPARDDIENNPIIFVATNNRRNSNSPFGIPTPNEFLCVSTIASPLSSSSLPPLNANRRIENFHNSPQSVMSNADEINAKPTSIHSPLRRHLESKIAHQAHDQVRLKSAGRKRHSVSKIILASRQNVSEIMLADYEGYEIYSTQNVRYTTIDYTNHDSTTSDYNLTTTIGTHMTWETGILATLGALISLLTVCGNLIVILSFFLERAIRQPANYFIASLAVSDLLIGLVSMPLYTLYVLTSKRWTLGEVFCDVWLSIDYTACLCSIYTVFCITIDRFCSIKIPTRYRLWRTEKKILIVVSLIWMIPISVFFTTIFGWQYFVGKRTVPVNMCFVQYMEDALFNCLLQIGYFWITLVAMVVLYSGIYK